MIQMVHAALKGDWAEADRVEAALSELFKVEFIETNPIPIKTALAMCGMCEEAFRLPMCTLEKPEHREAVAAVLKQMKLMD